MAEEQPDTNTSTIRFSEVSDRLPETVRRKDLVDGITAESFDEWYQEKQFRENILEGRPYFNGSSPPPEATRHSPSRLLQCHRKTRYYGQNTPQEGNPPTGIFWVGTKFEEELVVPYLLDAVTTTDTYVRNSIWIDTEIETESEVLRVKGMTDPAIVDADGEPILVTEIKTTSSLEYLDGPKAHHKAQLHAYMDALDKAYDRSITDGVLLYGSRETFDIEVFHVPFDDEFWKTVAGWMETQTQYRENQELPPATPVFDWECGSCPFKQRCGEGESHYSDVAFTGLLPGVKEYQKSQLVEYFDAYPDAKLTPTLAVEYPELVDEHGVYDWQCGACGAVYAWDETWDKDRESLPPVCPQCAGEDSLQFLSVPEPAAQVSSAD